ncbi:MULTISPECIES: hypothetical protein [unclassified Peribacillus]|uniref:hypothetical protein n=1 Tax=unclassified Peribacillus TaxID=2675266 RepID=UPI00366A6D50
MKSWLDDQTLINAAAYRLLFAYARTGYCILSMRCVKVIQEMMQVKFSYCLSRTLREKPAQ